MTTVPPSLLRAVLFAVTLALSSCFCVQERSGRGAKVFAVQRQPVLVPVIYQQRERYQLLTPPWSFTDIRGKEEEVPVGLIVDGASVPRSVWWFMPPDGLHRAAALAHDWGYANRGRLLNGNVLTRAECDHMFYNLMRELGVGKFRASTAYNGVRLGGWHAWNGSDGKPDILPPYQLPRLLAKPKGPLDSRHIYATPIKQP
jgi:hypothetical protein